MAEVTLVEGGGAFVDEEGQPHFIQGYGGGRGAPIDLNTNVDLTSPIFEQVQNSIEIDVNGRIALLRKQ